jgi:hypothetical protein
VNRAEVDEKIEAYGRGFDLLTAALAEIPREAWSHRPAPGEWSVHEIVVHLADSESMSALRARKLIVEPGSTLMGYEEAKWADVLEYNAQSVEDALEIIRLARLSTYHLLKRQPDAVFTNAVTHPEYPDAPYTFEQWLDIYARHIPDHIEQIKNAFQVWQERQE